VALTAFSQIAEIFRAHDSGMLRLLANLLKDESAATAIEYALIGALVAVAIIIGATALGTALNSMYVAVDSKVEAAVNP
jgi:pilus assembly protein Flp/PilA